MSLIKIWINQFPLQINIFDILNIFQHGNKLILSSLSNSSHSGDKTTTTLVIYNGCSKFSTSWTMTPHPQKHLIPLFPRSNFERRTKKEEKERKLIRVKT